MERGGFNGYHHHHNLPRLSSSSDMNHHHHQGRPTHDPNIINGNPHMINPAQNNTTTTKSKIMISNSAAGSDQEQSTECTVREQDRFMPIANVIRIMRRTLPPHAKISDDAKETIQECVSEFIGFVTGEANDRCQREQRKTITAEDVLFAMSKLGFDDYVDPLSLFLHRFREMESGPDLLRASASSALVKRPSSSSSSAPNYDYGANYPFAHHQIYHNAVHPPPPGADTTVRRHRRDSSRRRMGSTTRGDIHGFTSLEDWAIKLPSV